MALLSTDPIDLLLDADGDLDLSSGGPVLSTGIDAVAQAVRIRLLLFAGEWFLNLDAGMPYYERDGVSRARAILGQKFKPAYVTRLFRNEILTTPGIATVDSLSVDFDNRTRNLTINWVATTSFGDTVSDTLATGQS